MDQLWGPAMFLGALIFIFSGYPHLAECDLFARYVLPELVHGPLDVVAQPVVV